MIRPPRLLAAILLGVAVLSAQAQELAARGYHVKLNDPYKGVELVRAYSDPKAGRHSLQIEISKRLYMDESTLQKNADFHCLRLSLAELLKEISKYIQRP